MADTSKTFGALTLQVLWMQASYAVVRPAAGFRTIELDGGAFELALLAAAFSLPALCLAFAVGRWTDAFGARRVLGWGTMMVLGSTVAVLVAPSVGWLLATSAFVGLGHLLCVVAQQALYSDGVKSQDRAFGTFTAAAAAGQIVGLPLSALAVALGRVHFAEGVAGLLCAGIFAALALVTIPRLAAGRRPARAERAQLPKTSVRALLAVPGTRAILLASGIVQASLELLMVFLPLWGAERGIVAEAVLVLLALRSLSTLASRLAVVPLVDLLGRHVLLTGSLLCAAVGLSVLPLVTLVGGVVIMIVLGVGLGLAQPLTMAWVVQNSAVGASGAAIGLRMAVNRLAQTVIPGAMTILAFGVSGVFLTTASLLLGGAAALVTSSRRNR